MFVFCIIALMFTVVILLRMIKKDYLQRNDLKSFNELINEFNTAYDQCENYIQQDIIFKDTEQCNEHGEYEMDFVTYFYLIKDTKELRKRLNYCGSEILSYEEGLKKVYGEMKHTEAYYKFRKSLKNVRENMMKFGERRD